MKRFILFFFLFIFSITWGQEHYFLAFQSDNDTLFFTGKVQKFDSKKEINKFLTKKQYTLIKKGHVLTSIDSMKWRNDTAFVQLYIGKIFKKIHITHDEKDDYIIRKTPKLNERLIRNFPFHPEEIVSALESLTHYLNNRGYPFASVYLTPEKISSQSSKAVLHIEKGPIVRYQKIIIKGKSKIKSKYVQNAISIKQGDLYSAQLLEQIESKIKQIKFVHEIRPYELLFTSSGAQLYLYLESRPVSSVNGIVGIQPNPTTGKTTVTGDVQLQLTNILRQGEDFGLHWQSLKPKTQDLNVHFQFPFLFNTPFGVQADFNLHKEDSSYLNLKFNIGVLYYLSGGSYIKVFYHSKTSNLLSDTPSTITDLSKISENSYGIGFYRSQLDYLPNPSSGFQVSAELAAGQRKSSPTKDSTVTTTTFSGKLNVEAFIPITPRNVIRLANTTESYYAPKIFKNEMYRFGGLKEQRGFDEESLYATTLTTFTLEYRFLVDKDSHAFAFYDQSFYEKNTSDYVKDNPFGFGLGYAFGTKIGIFSISYALGKQFNNPIQIKEGKIHFGYIAYF